MNYSLHCELYVCNSLSFVSFFVFVVILFISFCQSENKLSYLLFISFFFWEENPLIFSICMCKCLTGTLVLSLK